MSLKMFYSTIRVIFSLILILHLARIIFGWGAVIGRVSIPLWASWAAVIIAAFVLYQEDKLDK